MHTRPAGGQNPRGPRYLLFVVGSVRPAHRPLSALDGCGWHPTSTAQRFHFDVLSRIRQRLPSSTMAPVTPASNVQRAPCTAAGLPPPPPNGFSHPHGITHFVLDLCGVGRAINVDARRPDDWLHDDASHDDPASRPKSRRQRSMCGDSRFLHPASIHPIPANFLHHPKGIYGILVML